MVNTDTYCSILCKFQEEFRRTLLLTIPTAHFGKSTKHEFYTLQISCLAMAKIQLNSKIGK